MQAEDPEANEVTKRKAAAATDARRDRESALREAEARFRLAALAADDVIWDVDLRVGEIGWNEALTRRFGHAPEGLTTSLDWWKALVHPDDRDRVSASFTAAARGPSDYWMEAYRLARADGSHAPVIDRGYMIRDEAGAVTRVVGAILDLSERVRADAALKESEARFRHLADHAPMMVWTTDATGQTDYLSRSWYEFTGQTPETGLGRLWAAALHPDDRPAVARLFAERAARREPFEVELRIRRADGAWRWLLDAACPRFAEDGRFLGYVGSLLDITERREVETALRASEERLRLAQEAAGLGTFDWDLETGRIDACGLYRRIYGLGADEDVTLERLDAVTHPADRERTRERRQRAARGEADGAFEYRICRGGDGALRWVRVTARTLRDGAGRPVRRIGIAEDISERMFAEQALRESEENFRYTVELSPQLAWTADPDGSNIDFKRPFSDFPDFAEPTEAGDRTDQLTHPDDRHYRMREWEFSLSSGRPYDVEFRARRPDGGYRWVRSRGWPRRDEAGRIVRWYGITEDIHDRRMAEQQLQRLHDELNQVARVSAMGTLASALAHELNQPLTAVANYMAGSRRLLADQGADALPVIAEALERAGRAAVQAGEIVRRLRDLVNKGEVNRQPIDLAQLIHEVCELTLGDLRERAIGLSLEFGPGTRQACADRIQIQQVFTNLLRNAAEAMEGQPTRVITISTALHADEQVIVRVADTGPGVSPEVKRHLFSPFVSTKSTGMGVGLPICRSIVEAHGGQLWVEDALGGGAVFCFTLPKA